MVQQAKRGATSEDAIEALRKAQMATLNILEDFNAEKGRLEGTQRAVLNILDDFDEEKSRLETTQRATFNILEDFNAEKGRLEGTQRAVLNILDDFNEEKSRLETTQRATFNILEDFNAEKGRLEGTQRAVLNILDDLNQSNEELQKAHSVLELRVQERTAELQQANVRLRAEMKEREKAQDTVMQLNRDLEQRAQELTAANRELEAFAYSVSHDLRAPLRSVDGFGQALIEEYRDKIDPQGQDYLRRMRAASQRMAQLIDDLLNLSRITRREMRRQSVDMSALARDMAEELRKTQPERTVEFVIAPQATVDGDPGLLRIMLDNLMGNAWKFTGKHPRARIEFGVTLGLKSEEKVYFVRDDGVGFDMAYANKLFGAFQRLHSTKEFSGTGIGLATCQRIVHRHGGRIWVEAAVGEGATFYFTLG